MNQPVTVADFRIAGSGQLYITKSPEKQLVSNLAEQANILIARDGFSDDVRDIVQAIATLKQN
ncbi:hypothetical protein NOM01_11195 [Sporolactobacillus sp. STSJ-5]|uniref:hypothetical protein n=1 Tax=Sporolactobacillus sp. STSJ-5 TaxID=2965076 RepID=UPI0021033572|nr:hypothetical protein [Sporolactobacillus sp. STSJ-5]MCQ2010582.1 hypothetical protein [Sporolactobacillus sp. STSJ-5]